MARHTLDETSSRVQALIASATRAPGRAHTGAVVSADPGADLGATRGSARTEDTQPLGWIPTRPAREAADLRPNFGAARSRTGVSQSVDGESAAPWDDPEPGQPDPWFHIPEDLRASRWAVSRRAVLGVALTVAVVLLILGARWLSAGTASRGEPEVAFSRASPSFSGSDGSLPSASATDEARTIVVSVVGKVKRPGLRTLPNGARIADAIKMAGGATASGDTLPLNLAEKLADGQQVTVPAKGEQQPAGQPGPNAAAGGSAAGGVGSLVNLNTADAGILEQLPGVGPVLAGRIVDFRTQRGGRFASVDELNQVSGIGEKIFAQLAPLVTVGP